MNHTRKNPAPLRECNFDLDALLHPAGAFAHPKDVVADKDLTLNEKRAILASWASDACAVEAAPDLRTTPLGATVRWDDIMDALRLLDAQAAELPRPSRARWHRWRRWRQSPDGEAGQGTAPN
jgi:hypothetical protein